jgi:hypothetical protein
VLTTHIIVFINKKRLIHYRWERDNALQHPNCWDLDYGMHVHRWSGLYSVDRLLGRGLTPDTVEDAVAAFVFDGKTVRTLKYDPDVPLSFLCEGAWVGGRKTMKCIKKGGEREDNKLY